MLKFDTMPHYTTGYNESVMVFIDGDGMEAERFPIVFCETDEEFEAFASGDGLAAKFDGEYYVKVRDDLGDMELLTATEANERIGEQVYAENKAATMINGNAVETAEQAAAAIPAGTVYLSDGVDEPWEPAFFLEAMKGETGVPCGNYNTFTAAQWEAEVAAATQD